MRTTAYIMLATSGISIFLLLLVWIIGLVAGQTFGGLLHLLLFMAMIAVPVFAAGLVMLIVSFVKQPK
jgi:hypothetical protein